MTASYAASSTQLAKSSSSDSHQAYLPLVGRSARGTAPGGGTAALEIRLGRDRDIAERRALGEAAVVFRAYHFIDLRGAIRPIDRHALPRHRERARILDPEDHLEAFAFLIIDHAIALGDVKLVGMRRSVIVDDRNLARLQPDRIDDENVAFVMADRFAEPGRFHFRRMLLVQPHVAHQMIALIDDEDAVLALRKLHGFAQIDDLRYPNGAADVVRLVDVPQLDFAFGVLLDDLAHPGLQNRVVVFGGDDFLDVGPVDPLAFDGLAFLVAWNRQEGDLAPDCAARPQTRQIGRARFALRRRIDRRRRRAEEKRAHDQLCGRFRRHGKSFCFRSPALYRVFEHGENTGALHDIHL